ncbi:FAD-dependent oxidoreductase [Chloroflexota bacterium]
MTRLTKLFEPAKIGTMEVKNRLVMAPMATFSCEEGFITDRTVDYYALRAKGGVGFIIAQAASIVVQEPGHRNTPGLYDDKFIPKLRELSGGVHEYGAKIAIQLVHHGIHLAQQHRLRSLGQQKVDIVAPSEVEFIPTGVTARELSKEEIKNVIEAFAEAVRRAKEAGFDAVEIHGAHGYLVSNFLSPFYNKRADEYGGSLEKRATLVCEIVRRTKEKVGPDFPVLIRFNGDDGIEGGTKIEDAVQYAKIFEKEGVVALDISAGQAALSPLLLPNYMHPVGAIVHLAAAVKKVVNVPVVTVGKIIHPIFAENLLEEGKADFIALGRPLLADPEWPNKAREGRFEEIINCIYCNNHRRGFWGGGYGLTGRGLACTVNPSLLRETEFALKPVISPKRVMVIGGGLAGMEAAAAAAHRGHHVSLYERSDMLGGQWNIAYHQEHKKHFALVARRMASKLDKTGVKVVLNREVTARFVKQAKPDVVIIATGAKPVTLDIPGARGCNVVQAVDVIIGRANVGDRVVVIGGRYIGMEMAISLSEQGKGVWLVTRSQLGRDVDTFIRLTLRDRLIELGIPLLPHSQLLKITNEGVSFVRDRELLFIKADSVVLAVGYRSEKKLAEQLRGVIPEMMLHMVGDCVKPRSALEAVNEGAEIGRQI